MTAPTISRQTALDDLLGTSCRGCGGTKKSGMSHCRRCYFSLPKRIRTALYRRIGQGYEAAYSESIETLRTVRCGDAT